MLDIEYDRDADDSVMSETILSAMADDEEMTSNALKSGTDVSMPIGPIS